MRNANVFAVIEARARTAGNAVCLRTADDKTFTYHDLRTITAGYARYLHELGVGPGERVAVQVDKSPQNLFLYLAVLRLGAIYLPLNVGYTLAELAFFLADAEPRVFFCGEDQFEDKQALARQHGISRVLLMRADGSGALDDCDTGASAEYPTQARAADDTALILYTSGTTGKPKGAMITHGNLRANGQALVDRWQFTSRDVLLHALPLFHAHGLFISCHCALFTASEILFLEKFDAPTVIELLPRASVMMGVPTFYTRLLDEPGFGAHVARHVRVFISGSAPLTEQISTAFHERTEHRILERYGMTETGIITSNPYDGERRVGSVGLPLEGVHVRIGDEHGRTLAAQKVGMIQVAGHSVMAGYWRNPDKTAEAFTEDGWFCSGDLGCVDDDGYLSAARHAGPIQDPQESGEVPGAAAQHHGQSS